jgi:hypothetical protein
LSEDWLSAGRLLSEREWDIEELLVERKKERKKERSTRKVFPRQSYPLHSPSAIMAPNKPRRASGSLEQSVERADWQGLVDERVEFPPG